MQLRVRSGPRAAVVPVGFEPSGLEPAERARLADDALGLAVMRLLMGAFGAGAPPPAAVLFGGEHVHIVELLPLLRAGEALDGRGVSGLASVPDVVAMAVVGVFTRSGPGAAPTRYAVAFVEWSDGRWWLGRRSVVEADGAVQLNPLAEVEVERAVDGAGKPRGLGGWFRRVRVEGLSARLSPRAEEPVN